MKKNIELLAPAGNFEKLKIALAYGADAVYAGGKDFNLRVGSHNFSNDELQEAVKYTHSRDKKIYITLNIVARNKEINSIKEYATFLDQINVDGVIVSDLGVFKIVKENTNLNISISTQASNTNVESVKMWRDLGASRIVLARELSLEEIYEIRKNVPDIELEVFIHGAMCMAISGRCLLSNYMTGRDANKGDCAQSCRWKYYLVEEERPEEYIPVYEDKRGSYIFSSKDLCTIEFIDKILELGIDSLKIEGRMKGIYYLAIVVKTYREAVYNFLNGKYKYNKKWIKDLESISHRKYTSGFYLQGNNSTLQNYSDRNSYSQSHALIAKVEEVLECNRYLLGVRNKINVGDTLDIVSTANIGSRIVISNIMLKSKNGVIKSDSANPNSKIIIKSDIPLKPFDMLRKKL